MDYEVFLVTRMREAWDAGLDNAGAVADGLERTGRIVTAAAIIMVAARLAGRVFHKLRQPAVIGSFILTAGPSPSDDASSKFRRTPSAQRFATRIPASSPTFRPAASPEARRWSRPAARGRPFHARCVTVKRCAV